MLVPRLAVASSVAPTVRKTKQLLPLFQLSFFSDARQQRKLKHYRFRQRENWKRHS
jgi:hypothetical protein